MLTMTAVYSPEVLDHFEHPRNVGEASAATAAVQVENPACGDIMRLSIRVAEGRIAEVRYRAQGCVPAIACGSALTEMVQGRTVEEAQRVKREELVRVLGGLPPASAHASHLAMDALTAVLKQVASV